MILSQKKERRGCWPVVNKTGTCPQMLNKLNGTFAITAPKPRVSGCCSSMLTLDNKWTQPQGKEPGRFLVLPSKTANKAEQTWLWHGHKAATMFKEWSFRIWKVQWCFLCAFHSSYSESKSRSNYSLQIAAGVLNNSCQTFSETPNTQWLGSDSLTTAALQVLLTEPGFKSETRNQRLTFGCWLFCDPSLEHWSQP